MLRDVHAHISVQETSIRSTTPFVIRQQDPSIQHRSHATRTVCMKSARLCYPLQPRRTRGCCKNTLSKRGQMKGKDMGCRIWHQSRSCSTSVFLRLFGVSACAVLLLNSAGLGDVNQVCAHTGGLTKGLFPDQPVKLLELHTQGCGQAELQAEDPSFQQEPTCGCGSRQPLCTDELVRPSGLQTQRAEDH